MKSPVQYLPDNDITQLPVRAQASRYLSEDVDSEQDSETAPPQANILAGVHGLLRGRYPLAIALAIIGGVVGAGAAWKLSPTRYQSNALIVINSSVDTILTADKNSTLLNIDSVIGSQQAMIQSQRVIEQAMKDPEWLKLNRGTSPKDVADFTHRLEVEHPNHSEMLRVGFVDSDPEAAMVSVQSTVRAYLKLYKELQETMGDERLQVLIDRRTQLTNDLKAINLRIEGLAQEYGSANLDARYTFATQQENLLDAEYRKIQLALAAAEAHSPNIPAGGPPEKMSAEEIARTDPDMRNLLTRKREADTNIMQLQLKYGADHPILASARSGQKAIEQEIDRLVRTYSNGGGAPVEHGEAAVPFGTPDSLRAHEHSVLGLREEYHKNVVELGRKILQIQDLQSEAENVRSNLLETKTRIEHLQVEAQAHGRIQVISEGDRPIEPYNDKRQALTAAGGAGGAVFCVGILAVTGLIAQRVRHAEDIKPGNRQNLRLLGMLPHLRDLSDQEQVITAAHRIHNIRAMLQVRAQQQEEHVFAVTSPSPGAGKTSLTVALGTSFAASGSITLLIDCDLIGGGLSARVNVNRRVGNLLCEKKLITQEQLEEALLGLRKSSARLCSFLLEKGWIHGADADTALEIEGQSQLGLLDVLAGAPLEQCVQETGIPNLFVLPLCVAGSRHVGQLSPKVLRSLFAKARATFDAVIVDTGPVIGCPEATMVCGEADEVLLTLSRGEQRPLVERSIDSLIMAHARLAGVVFNRADVSDIKRSGYSSTARSRTDMSPVTVGIQNIEDSNGIFRLGPLGAAVVSETAAISGRRNGHGNGNH